MSGNPPHDKRLFGRLFVGELRIPESERWSTGGDVIVLQTTEGRRRLRTLLRAEALATALKARRSVLGNSRILLASTFDVVRPRRFEDEVKVDHQAWWLFRRAMLTLFLCVRRYSRAAEIAFPVEMELALIESLHLSDYAPPWILRASRGLCEPRFMFWKEDSVLPAVPFSHQVNTATAAEIQTYMMSLRPGDITAAREYLLELEGGSELVRLRNDLGHSAGTNAYRHVRSARAGHFCARGIYLVPRPVAMKEETYELLGLGRIGAEALIARDARRSARVLTRPRAAGAPAPAETDYGGLGFRNNTLFTGRLNSVNAELLVPVMDSDEALAIFDFVGEAARLPSAYGLAYVSRAFARAMAYFDHIDKIDFSGVVLVKLARTPTRRDWHVSGMMLSDGRVTVSFARGMPFRNEWLAHLDVLTPSLSSQWQAAIFGAEEPLASTTYLWDGTPLCEVLVKTRGRHVPTLRLRRGSEVHIFHLIPVEIATGGRIMVLAASFDLPSSIVGPGGTIYRFRSIHDARFSPKDLAAVINCEVKRRV